MFTTDLARLRQLCQLEIPGQWLASILFAELRSCVPCEAMTLLWCEPGAVTARLLHESESELTCDLIDARVLHQDSLTAPCISLAAEDTTLQRCARLAPGLQALSGQALQTLALRLADATAQQGTLLLHRCTGQFSAAEKSSLLHLAPVMASALRTKSEPSQLMTSRTDTGVLLLDSDYAIRRSSLQARKLLQLAQAPADRAHVDTGHELTPQVRSGIDALGKTQASSFVLRNRWGSFEFFRYSFAAHEANAEQLTAVAVHRQEPLSLSVLRGCRELGLTSKQTAIALLLVKGSSNDAVAARLRIRASTVADHVRKIYLKVGAGSRTELVAALALSAKKPNEEWSSYPSRHLSASIGLDACPRK